MQREDVDIRMATGSADVDAVRRLMAEYGEFLSSHPTGSEHFCMGGFTEELAGLPLGYLSPGALLLGRVAGEAAGCVGVRELRVMGPMAAIHEDEGGGLALEIKRLWVRPGGRGVGLGARLMEAAVTYARRQGASCVYLDTVPGAMPEAMSLYVRLGFERVPRYNGNSVSGVAHFRRRLRSAVEPTQVTLKANPTIS